MKEQMLKILTEVSKGGKTPELAQIELFGLFSVMLSDLPQEFYDKFVERQVKECGDKLLGNTDEQYYYARGFLATIEILKECYH